MADTKVLIQFAYGLQDNYDKLASKDLNTLYFCTDSGRLFKGDVEFSRPVQHGTALPGDFMPPDSTFVVEAEEYRDLFYSKDGASWEKIGRIYKNITIGTKGEATARTLAFGDTFKVVNLTVDSHGFVTSANEVELTLPEAVDISGKVESGGTVSITGDAAGTGTQAANGDVTVSVTISDEFAKKTDLPDMTKKVDVNTTIKLEGDATGSVALPENGEATISVEVSHATAADSATKDSKGNVIADTYLKAADLPDYDIVKTQSDEYAAVYQLTKNGTPIGAAINIPKDIVVKSGSVVDNKIVLVLNDEAGTQIEIPVESLIEYVTSGSQTGDMVVITVDNDHKVTATITDKSITLNKLAAEVTDAISAAENNAKAYADGLAGNYDAAGSASTAEQNAKDYADSLASNYDTAGAASTAEQNAKDYADGLANNYDAAGSASTAEQNAKNYTDDQIAAAALTWQSF